MTVTIELPINREVPEIVSSRWCAETFGITISAVNAAIQQGRLPAERFGHVWAIRSEDALKLWGHFLLRSARQKTD